MKESYISKFNTGQWIRNIYAKSNDVRFLYVPSSKEIKYFCNPFSSVSSNPPNYCKLSEDTSFFRICMKCTGMIEFITPSTIRYKK